VGWSSPSPSEQLVAASAMELRQHPAPFSATQARARASSSRSTIRRASSRPCCAGWRPTRPEKRTGTDDIVFVEDDLDQARVGETKQVVGEELDLALAERVVFQC